MSGRSPERDMLEILVLLFKGGFIAICFFGEVLFGIAAIIADIVYDAIHKGDASRNEHTK